MESDFIEDAAASCAGVHDFGNIMDEEQELQHKVTGSLNEQNVIGKADPSTTSEAERDVPEKQEPNGTDVAPTTGDEDEDNEKVSSSGSSPGPSSVASSPPVGLACCTSPVRKRNELVLLPVAAQLKAPLPASSHEQILTRRTKSETVQKNNGNYGPAGSSSTTSSSSGALDGSSGERSSSKGPSKLIELQKLDGETRQYTTSTGVDLRSTSTKYGSVSSDVSSSAKTRTKSVEKEAELYDLTTGRASHICRNAGSLCAAFLVGALLVFIGWSQWAAELNIGARNAPKKCIGEACNDSGRTGSIDRGNWPSSFSTLAGDVRYTTEQDDSDLLYFGVPDLIPPKGKAKSNWHEPWSANDFSAKVLQQSEPTRVSHRTGIFFDSSACTPIYFIVVNGGVSIQNIWQRGMNLNSFAMDPDARFKNAWTELTTIELKRVGALEKKEEVEDIPDHEDDWERDERNKRKREKEMRTRPIRNSIEERQMIETDAQIFFTEAAFDRADQLHRAAGYRYRIDESVPWDDENNIRTYDAPSIRHKLRERIIDLDQHTDKSPRGWRTRDATDQNSEWTTKYRRTTHEVLQMLRQRQEKPESAMTGSWRNDIQVFATCHAKKGIPIVGLGATDEELASELRDHKFKHNVGDSSSECATSVHSKLQDLSKHLIPIIKLPPASGPGTNFLAPVYRRDRERKRFVMNDSDFWYYRSSEIVHRLRAEKHLARLDHGKGQSLEKPSTTQGVNEHYLLHYGVTTLDETLTATDAALAKWANIFDVKKPDALFRQATTLVPYLEEQPHPQLEHPTGVFFNSGHCTAVYFVLVTNSAKHPLKEQSTYKHFLTGGFDDASFLSTMKRLIAPEKSDAGVDSTEDWSFLLITHAAFSHARTLIGTYRIFSAPISSRQLTDFETKYYSKIRAYKHVNGALNLEMIAKMTAPSDVLGGLKKFGLVLSTKKGDSGSTVDGDPRPAEVDMRTAVVADCPARAAVALSTLNEECAEKFFSIGKCSTSVREKMEMITSRLIPIASVSWTEMPDTGSEEEVKVITGPAASWDATRRGFIIQDTSQDLLEKYPPAVLVAKTQVEIDIE
ncbi:unnamed protein product [Amoebophrya sp. A25]|nr:unnamed protein product [Amoebophrya sp. A25]|eukprot:GSA25T00011882001.1